MIYFAEIGRALNQFGAFIGIGGLVVVAFVYFYSTAKRGRQDIVRQDNRDLRDSNQEMRTEKAGMEATIKNQTDTIQKLQEIATQTPAVTRLIEMNNKQQQITADHHGQVLDGLSALTAEMGQVAKELSNLAKQMNKGNNRGRVKS